MTLHKQKLKRNYNKLPNWQKRILRETNRHIHIFSVRDYENVDAIKIEKMWQILEICIPTRESETSDDKGSQGGDLLDASQNQYGIFKNIGRIITTPAGMIHGGYQYYQRQQGDY